MKWIMILALLMMLLTPSMVAACSDHTSCLGDPVHEVMDHDPCCQAIVLPQPLLPVPASFATVFIVHSDEAISKAIIPPKRPPKLR